MSPNLSRRGFLGSGLAVTQKALVGSYLLSNANILVPERSLHIAEDPTELVLQTATIPEPLGYVTYQIGRVEIHRNRQEYTVFGADRRYTLTEPMMEVTITGMVRDVDMHREQAFFDTAFKGEPLRLYFAKEPFLT